MGEGLTGKVRVGVIYGVLESGEKVVPLGFGESWLGLIRLRLAMNGGFDQTHGLTSHVR